MTRSFGSNGGGDGNGDGLAGRLDRIFRIAGIVGLLGLLACILGAIFDVQQVLRSYLIAYIFWIGLPLGCTSLLLLNHLAGGTWGLTIRRPLEAGASTLLLMTPLFLPLAIGIGQIYPWAGAQHGEAEAHDSEAGGDPEMEAEGTTGTLEPDYDFAEVPATEDADGGHAAANGHKEIWFGRAFYFGRTIGYFAVWGLFAFLLVRWSDEQDRATDPGPVTRRLGLIGAPGLILLFLSGTFAMFDWAMSLDPEWYSTIYGAMLIVGMGLQTFALTNFVTALLADYGALGDILTQPRRLRDLGNLMLAFVMLWAYTAYSQLLIIWSGDLSEEIPWYLERSEHGWRYVAAFLMVFHFFLPFFVLLFRANKDSTVRLRAISALIFAVHVVDLYWLLGPSLGYERPLPHLLDFAALAGVGGLWVATYTFFLKSRPLVVRNDPALIELQEHERLNVPHPHTGV